MSNEAQYYHPIIEAMLQHRTNALEQERMQNAVTADKARLALETQAQARADKALDYQHDYEQQSLANTHDLTQSLLAQRQLEQRRQQYQDVASGVAKVKPDPMNGLRSLLPYSGESVDPTTLSSPQELQELEAQGAGKKIAAVTGAQAAALQPFQIAQEQRQFKYGQMGMIQQHLNDMDKLAQQGVNEGHLAQIHNEGQMAVAQLNGRNHIIASQIAQGTDPTMPPEEQTALMENHIHALTSGNEDSSALSPIMKKKLSQYTAQTGWIIPDKKFGDNLTTIAGLQDTLSQALDAAHKYSFDKTTSWQRMNKGQFANIPLIGVPESEANNAFDQVNSRALQLAKTFDSNNRGSQPEAQRQIAGLIDPKKTEAENVANINAKIGTLNTLINQRTAGMPVEQKNYALQSRGINMFGGFINPSGGTPGIGSPGPGTSTAPAAGPGIPNIRNWGPNGLSPATPTGGLQ